jgi:hypothetical protein
LIDRAAEYLLQFLSGEGCTSLFLALLLIFYNPYAVKRIQVE